MTDVGSLSFITSDALQKVFIAAYQEGKLKKADFLSLDIDKCIQEVVNHKNINLRHLGGAVVGCARIYSKKCTYLADDAKKTLETLEASNMDTVIEDLEEEEEITQKAPKVSTLRDRMNKAVVAPAKRDETQFDLPTLLRPAAQKAKKKGEPASLIDSIINKNPTLAASFAQGAANAASTATLPPLFANEFGAADEFHDEFGGGGFGGDDFGGMDYGSYDDLGTAPTQEEDPLEDAHASRRVVEGGEANAAAEAAAASFEEDVVIEDAPHMNVGLESNPPLSRRPSTASSVSAMSTADVEEMYLSAQQRLLGSGSAAAAAQKRAASPDLDFGTGQVIAAAANALAPSMRKRQKVIAELTAALNKKDGKDEVGSSAKLAVMTGFDIKHLKLDKATLESWKASRSDLVQLGDVPRSVMLGTAGSEVGVRDVFVDSFNATHPHAPYPADWCELQQREKPLHLQPLHRLTFPAYLAEVDLEADLVGEAIKGMKKDYFKASDAMASLDFVHKGTAWVGSLTNFTGSVVSRNVIGGIGAQVVHLANTMFAHEWRQHKLATINGNDAAIQARKDTLLLDAEDDQEDDHAAAPARQARAAVSAAEIEALGVAQDEDLGYGGGDYYDSGNNYYDDQILGNDAPAAGGEYAGLDVEDDEGLAQEAEEDAVSRYTSGSAVGLTVGERFDGEVDDLEEGDVEAFEVGFLDVFAQPEGDVVEVAGGGASEVLGTGWSKRTMLLDQLLRKRQLEVLAGLKKATKKGDSVPTVAISAFAMVGGSQARAEFAAACFLELLNLQTRGKVQLHQEEAFGDLLVVVNNA